MNSIILNRNLEISLKNSAPDAPAWFHLVPIGKFPGVLQLANGKSIRVIQHIDSAAISAIANNFHDKILVDFEHRSSLPDGDTAAAAWLTKVESRAEGLWGMFDFSDLGKTAVENKRYRFLSPELDVDATSASKDGDTVRPLALRSVGLTNRPNMKSLTPLSNKQTVDAASSRVENQNAADQAGKEQMKELITALGLPENSEMPAVLNAVQALQTQATELSTVKNQLAALHKTQLESEVEKDLVKFAPVIQNREEVKTQLIANREATLKVLTALKPAPAEKGPTVHNRAGAKTPDATNTVANKAADQKAFIALVKNRDKVDHKTAFNTARHEKPELFKEETPEE